jgi:hypothetical protein
MDIAATKRAYANITPEAIEEARRYAETLCGVDSRSDKKEECGEATGTGIEQGQPERL